MVVVMADNWLFEVTVSGAVSALPSPFLSPGRVPGACRRCRCSRMVNGPPRPSLLTVPARATDPVLHPPQMLRRDIRR